jgi:hypothetical protein
MKDKRLKNKAYCLASIALDKLQNKTRSHLISFDNFLIYVQMIKNNCKVCNIDALKSICEML